jgi:hypothetical protein
LAHRVDSGIDREGCYHLAHDDLVAWGWQPSDGRDPAPGSQALLGELIQAWIDTGAQCP